MKIFQNDWATLLQPEMEKSYFKKLQDFINREYHSYNIYPDKHNIYRALDITPYKDVKVVILGQDPYHNNGQAHGLSFSVPQGVPKPPSLKNIYKELQMDLGYAEPDHGCLESWAEQGVLLLNTVLTVREGQAHSHKNKGWETFTNKVISLLNDRKQPVIFVLWGKPAQAKQKLITNDHHTILQAAHPSPLSAYRGFFGSRPFSSINNELRTFGVEEIDWELRAQ
ncbi:uracil-DNA glycosylase [Bacillus sp. HMF5848]|uniref:uracil-DNA glycosylase n=1 Tax=Bacillus sp. HMF5848 TaxID=2495421 RepID=UPI000F792E2A|nr:uracil-DNA glycosylase [Bacillus sp. HMF5848]RSK29009.1 uracil-DNA glycosylase [Bacillus sp. HMF5848]